MDPVGASLPPLTYLSVDSVTHGVGLSQVARYVERLAEREVTVTLHSFETTEPDRTLSDRMAAAGVKWHRHRFRPGVAAGAARAIRGASLVATAELVHARSDLAAASTLLALRPAWIWDVRSFWREQRMALGMLREGSAYERTMRAVEATSARRSTAIVTLSQSAAEVLGHRFGAGVTAKSHVITTCVDLDRFACTPLPRFPPIRFLLAGTLNRLYDVPCMMSLVARAHARGGAALTVLEPAPSPWDELFVGAGIVPQSAPAAVMPERIADHHIGLSVLRKDVGPSNCAATPTKIGEFLASGRPVVVNPGLGDLDRLLVEHDCGVVVRDCSTEGLDRVIDELQRLLEDVGMPSRCRALAERHFDLERGVDQLLAAYTRAAHGR